MILLKILLIYLITLLEYYKPEDVDPKVKGKLKDLLESGLSSALEVGKYFNIMTKNLFMSRKFLCCSKH